MLSNKLENGITNNDINEWEDIRHYFLLLWHWTWLIGVIAVFFAGNTFFIFQRMTPVYETSTKVLVIAAPALQSTSYNSVLTSQNLVPTYADLLTNESVLSEVISRMGLAQSTISLAKMITVNPVPNTLTIKISVDGVDRDQIAQIANTLVTVFIEKINTIQSDRFTSSKDSLQNELTSIDALLQAALADEEAATDPVVKSQLDAKVLQYRSMYATVLTNYEQARLAEIQTTSSVVQVGQAGTSYLQVSPKTTIYTLVAGILGLLLAAGFVFLHDLFDNTIKSADEVTRVLKLPVLGIIYKHNTKDGLITQTEPFSPASNGFRSLRTNLQYADVDNPIRSILITSPSSAEGKSIISANLAVVLAQTDNRVTLIDADFHRPSIHECMNLSNSRGLTTFLSRSVISVDEILQPTQIGTLFVIAAGQDIPQNGTEILASKKMSETLKYLLAKNGMVILDTPPVLPVADTRILAPLVDGVLLVVQAGQTTLDATRQAVENLHRVNARIIGVVLNNVALKNLDYNQYYRNKDENKPRAKKLLNKK